jgi:hypothetical protein
MIVFLDGGSRFLFGFLFPIWQRGCCLVWAMVGVPYRWDFSSSIEAPLLHAFLNLAENSGFGLQV